MNGLVPSGTGVVGCKPESRGQDANEIGTPRRPSDQERCTQTGGRLWRPSPAKGYGRGARSWPFGRHAHYQVYRRQMARSAPRREREERLFIAPSPSNMSS